MSRSEFDISKNVIHPVTTVLSPENLKSAIMFLAPATVICLGY